MTWAIPQSDLAISQYQVQYRISGTPSWSSAPPLSGSPPATSTALNGLNAGSEYNVRVRAMSAVGAGIWSAEQTERIGSEFCALNMCCYLLCHHTCCNTLWAILYTMYRSAGSACCSSVYTLQFIPFHQLLCCLHQISNFLYTCWTVHCQASLFT